MLTSAATACLAFDLSSIRKRQLTLRVVTVEGQPWFVGEDLNGPLGMYPQLLSGRLKGLADDEKKRVHGGQYNLIGVASKGGQQQRWLVSESGLYKLIMRSDKPQARAFQDWATSEVLPSIRKMGAYVTARPSLVENPNMDHQEGRCCVFSG